MVNGEYMLSEPLIEADCFGDFVETPCLASQHGDRMSPDCINSIVDQMRRHAWRLYTKLLH